MPSWALSTARLCSPQSQAKVSAPASDTCPLLARDHAARCRVLGRPRKNHYGVSLRPCVAWCSQPRTWAASLGGALVVAHAAGRVAVAAPRPWWRGRVGAVLAITIGMVIAFFGWKNQLPWPASLTWNSLAGYLDNFQTWLSDSRNVPDPSFFFVAFNGIATFLDDLVGWITSFFFKLTWVGTAALGTLVVLRYGGRRPALGVVAAFAVFALTGLWEPSVQTFSLTIASV